MYKIRRENVFNGLEDGSMLILYSGKRYPKSADQSYPFTVNKHFYYLTGIDQEDTYLLMIKGNKKEVSYVFAEAYDELKALWDGAVLSFDKIKELSGADYVFDNKAFNNTLSSLLSPTRRAVYGDISNMYFDIEVMNINNDLSFAQKLANKIKERYPYLNILNINSQINYLRSIKDQHEVELIKKAIDITDQAINSLYKNAKAGLKEYQLEAYFNFVLDYNGLKPSFDTIAASGVNATVLHYVDNDDVINDNELILFDLGVEYEHYCSDISRTFPVNGKFTDRQKEIYEIVLHTNKEVIKMLRPGVTVEEFNNYAKKLLSDGLIRIGKIKDASELSKYYYHSIGHFLGLDVHDVGDYTKPFEAGQILTVEPGLYLADEEIGIRIEDNILITEDGYINLSEKLIKEVKDIEEFMKK